MLKISIGETEIFDEFSGRFIYVKPTVLKLEHSLISVSKWESRHHKPFLGQEEKTFEEELDYVRCMLLNDNVDESVIRSLSVSDFEAIRAYIEDGMTATTFRSNGHGRNSREIVTSEIIYYWMTALQIPFECEKWHLNRLLTLIRVCELKNTPSKKMKRKDQMAQQRSLNAARRARSGSRG